MVKKFMTCFTSLRTRNYESKVANALDKLEVQLQHNHADFSTWEEIEYDMSYMMDSHVLFDTTLFELKTQIENQATEKMKSNGIDTDLIRQRVFGPSTSSGTSFDKLRDLLRQAQGPPSTSSGTSFDKLRDLLRQAQGPPSTSS